jgi:predicted methyltransferase
VAIVRKILIDIGMQLPEKYKENFDVLSEGPSSES